jgi:ornithine cyclodeaminase/alanine dehydrogenase
MLFINRKTIEAIAEPLEMIKTVKSAFIAFGKGEYVMPERFGFEHEGKTVLFMPCFIKDMFGAKTLTLVPENRLKGLPAIDGLVILNHGETGEPLAILDGKGITAWRTGATGALAADLLSDKNSSRLGIIGCGVQGFYQALCICAIRKIKEINLYDKFSDTKDFAGKLRAHYPEAAIESCGETTELLEKSDIVVTTTFSENPVFPDDAALLRGKCYIAVGSYKPHIRELPDSVFSLSGDVYVDLMHACDESGDLISPMQRGLLKKERIKLLHGLMESPVKIGPDDTTVFKTVGMALNDIFAARYFYNTAMEKGLGVSLEM